MFLFPDVVAGNPLPLTGGLAAACLFAVLLVKLMGDPDHNLRQYRIVLALEALGALLYFVPYVFGVQFSPIAAGGPFESTSNWLVTGTNTSLAIALAYVSIALFAIMGAIATVYTIRTGGRAEVSEATTAS
jgi:hypothetical protein